MLSNITMGQYYPTDSIVHRLDPRVKILLTIAFIVGIFLVHSLWGVCPGAGLCVFYGVPVPRAFQDAHARAPSPAVHSGAHLCAEPVLLRRGHHTVAVELHHHYA